MVCRILICMWAFGLLWLQGGAVVIIITLEYEESVSSIWISLVTPVVPFCLIKLARKRKVLLLEEVYWAVCHRAFPASTEH